VEVFPSERLPSHIMDRNQTVGRTLYWTLHSPVNPALETLTHWSTPKWLQLFADGDKQMKPMRKG